MTLSLPGGLQGFIHAVLYKGGMSNSQLRVRLAPYSTIKQCPVSAPVQPAQSWVHPKHGHSPSISGFQQFQLHSHYMYIHIMYRGCFSQCQQDCQAHIIQHHNGVIRLSLALISPRVWHLHGAASAQLLQFPVGCKQQHVTERGHACTCSATSYQQPWGTTAA